MQASQELARTLTVYSSVVSTTASPLVTCSRPEASTAKCMLSLGVSGYFAFAASIPACSGQQFYPSHGRQRIL